MQRVEGPGACRRRDPEESFEHIPSPAVSPAYRLPDQHPLVLPGVRMDVTGDHLPSWVFTHQLCSTGGDPMAPTPLATLQPSTTCQRAVLPQACLRAALRVPPRSPVNVAWPHDPTTRACVVHSCRTTFLIAHCRGAVVRCDHPSGGRRGDPFPTRPHDRDHPGTAGGSLLLRAPVRLPHIPYLFSATPGTLHIARGNVYSRRNTFSSASRAARHLPSIDSVGPDTAGADGSGS
jgi:hypothetical protein